MAKTKQTAKPVSEDVSQVIEKESKTKKPNTKADKSESASKSESNPKTTKPKTTKPKKPVKDTEADDASEDTSTSSTTSSGGTKKPLTVKRIDKMKDADLRKALKVYPDYQKLSLNGIRTQVGGVREMRSELKGLCGLPDNTPPRNSKSKKPKFNTEGKSSKSMKTWLADQDIAYNKWKDADKEELVVLIYELCK